MSNKGGFVDTVVSGKTGFLLPPPPPNFYVAFIDPPKDHDGNDKEFKTTSSSSTQRLPSLLITGVPEENLKPWLESMDNIRSASIALDRKTCRMYAVDRFNEDRSYEKYCNYFTYVMQDHLARGFWKRNRRLQTWFKQTMSHTKPKHMINKKKRNSAIHKKSCVPFVSKENQYHKPKRMFRNS